MLSERSRFQGSFEGLVLLEELELGDQCWFNFNVLSADVPDRSSIADGQALKSSPQRPEERLTVPNRTLDGSRTRIRDVKSRGPDR